MPRLSQQVLPQQSTRVQQRLLAQSKQPECYNSIQTGYANAMLGAVPHVKIATQSRLLKQQLENACLLAHQQLSTS